ncbi:hypothetical protein [Plantibacter sp. MMLR14_011]|uniref:hypothetical protein n=1 Tax=Plantibacter sp. MMLR14_011 TaxID=1898746 RepID=UPI0008DD118B|nr:hypothetical protein [Plantibacter sp. MMLR14_011]OII39279.1 hypothetical protein BIU99_07815 [Plantibacter sp. MMLR14_011]
MSIVFQPTQSLTIAADQHGRVLPAVRSWADASTSFSVDRANDRIQIRRGGEEALEGALAALEEWMQDMVDVNKTTFVVNEWPNVIELRNRFEVPFTSDRYTAVPVANGEYTILGRQSVQVGRIVSTPDGLVAFRGSVLPDSDGVKTSPRSDARSAFEEFLKFEGFSTG